MAQRFRIDYACDFKLQNYPFDEQACSFSMIVKSTRYKKVSMHQYGQSIKYHGGPVIGQFKFRKTTSHVNEEGYFVFTIHLLRNYQDQIKTIFWPTCLLWILAYLTMFIDVDDFSNRSRISVTVLLALVTLFGSTSIKDDYPDTSYFKYIDLWFVWYLSCVFVITSHHIVVARLWVVLPPNMAVPFEVAEEGDILQENRRKRQYVNKLGLVFFITATASFNVVYFTLTNQN